MTTPLLGWIAPKDRTHAQHDAHARAWSGFHPSPRAAGLSGALPKGVKVVLTETWKDPLVAADVGREFTGFRQLTGSCVGVSAGNAVATLSFVQRKLADAPTRAFVPWWPFAYGWTRTDEGDRSPGEGALDSVMAATLVRRGTFGVDEVTDEPGYDAGDGLALTSSQEIQNSVGSSSINTKYTDLAKTHLVGSAAVCNSTEDVALGVVNGYPCLNGCSMYVGHGSLSGDVALGRYDGSGGHSTCILGFWDHPQQGPLFLYSNQWAGSTYPQDGSGKGRCCVWMKEADLARLWRLGGDGGECVVLSHLAYFPAQPAVQSWSQF